MSTLPNLMYKFNTIPIKISMTSLPGLDKIMLKSISKQRRPQIAKAIYDLTPSNY